VNEVPSQTERWIERPLRRQLREPVQRPLHQPLPPEPNPGSTRPCGPNGTGVGIRNL